MTKRIRRKVRRFDTGGYTFLNNVQYRGFDGAVGEGAMRRDMKASAEQLQNTLNTNSEGSKSGISAGTVGKVMQGLQGGAEIISSALTGINSVDSAAESLSNAANSVSNTSFGAPDSNALLSQSNFGLMGNVSYRDLLGSKMDNAEAVIGQSMSGAGTGASVGGPWGAAVGGATGLLGGLIGFGIKRRRAKKKAAELNRQIGIANQQAIANFGTAAENLDTQNDLDALSHYAAYGGPLTMRYTGTMSPFGNTFDKGGKIHIHIKPSKRGTFTAAAKKHGKSVQAFASQVLANKENYSPAMVKKANFARNFGGRKRAYGGFLEGQEYDLNEAAIKDLLDKGYEIEYI